MILLDLNQIMIANLFQQLKGHTDSELNESMLRHMVVNTIRSLKVKFSDEYGRLIICADGRNVWRKKEFPYYKANRKESREKDELDWPTIFKSLTTIKEELKEYFPYKVIDINEAEADDIIGTIAHLKGNELNMGEKILILSSDKDYIQLHIYGNVKQYDSINKKWVVHSDPKQYLQEHIYKGDRGDGIPNVLSPGDIFLQEGKRQKPVTKPRMAKWNNGDELTPELLANIERNRKLIDLSMVPEDLKHRIIDEFETENTKNCSKLLRFFIDKDLMLLTEHLSEFKERTQ